MSFCKRLTIVFCLLPLLGMLSACGELPRPFKTRELEDRKANNLLSIRAGRGVLVLPVTGTPDDEFAEKLSAAVIKGLNERELIAGTDPELGQAFLLSGLIEYEQGQVNHVWILRDRSDLTWGKGVAQIPADYIEWLGGSDRLMAGLGRQIAKEVALALNPAAAEAASKANNIEESRVAVTQVIGAPGDGNLSLARSLRAHLKGAGIPFTEDARKAKVHIAGLVSLIKVNDKVDEITLTWIFTKEDGSELARISQNNQVPHGMLDNRWGDAAYEATFALVGAVKQALAMLHRQSAIGN